MRLTNAHRAKRGKLALAAYVAKDELRHEPFETQIIDLLTDLLHLVTQEGERPSAMLRIACQHYDAEHAEEHA